jgi:hypothetical protein
MTRITRIRGKRQDISYPCHACNPWSRNAPCTRSRQWSCKTFCSLFFFLFSLYPGAAAGELPAVFVAHTAQGATVSGPLEEIREDWSLALKGEKAIRGTDLIELRRLGARLPAGPKTDHVLFLNGDQLPGTPMGLAGDFLRFRIDLGKTQEVRLPLSAVSVIWFEAPDGVEDAEI